MTEDLPSDIAASFDRAETFEPTEGGYAVTTTVFDASVTAESTERPTYSVRVRVPTLQAATDEEVGQTVADSWLETFERRLEDAPKSTRARVDLDAFSVERVDDTVHVEYAFTWSNPDRAADIAKTFVEYVEGTYVEGVIPGYDYVSPVADLLSNATHDGKGGTPL
jgi:hypothetical protein